MNKNNKKGIMLSSLFVMLITVLMTYSFFTTEQIEKPKSFYQVYLDGEKIGLIDSKENLYSLINEEQVEIKNEYKVDQVYPPKGFQIIKCNTYNEGVTTIDTIYDSIKEEKEFTVKGYTITIKNKEENTEPKYIYVLDQSIFEEAMKNYVKTFIGEERYKSYTEDTQAEISDTGYIIEKMFFKEEITIKESLISVSEKIYTDVNDLTKYLLFGNESEDKRYRVAQGDTVESIALENKLNVSELIIANESLKSENSLLAIGQELNVTLIAPVVSLVYEELVVEDVEQQFTTEYEEDNSKYSDYSKVKTEGVKGINRVTSRVQFTNGEQNQGVTLIGDPVVIRPVQNKVIVKGTKRYVSQNLEGGSYQGNSGSGNYVDTGVTWGWPTNHPYVISSQFGYRWGTLHDGLDISGTGYGSPIYAALDGVVVQAQYGGIVGSSAGLNVVIEHSNGYYTVYAHCSGLNVSAGQYVKRGQRIASMGKTGVATGTHLHFGVFTGRPYNGGKSINPMRLWG